MPGRIGTISRRTLVLRLTGGVIFGAALTAGLTANATTGPGNSKLEKVAANLAAGTPAAAAIAPRKVTPLRAATPRQAATKHAAPKHKQAAPKHAAPKQAAPKQAVAKRVVPKRADVKQKAAAPVASAQDVINLAKKQVGITEDGSGVTKFQKWYMTTQQARLTVRRDGGSIADYGNAAWCDMFVSWVGQQVGVRGMGQDAYTVEHAKWFQRTGHWGSTPKPGAVVFFAWNGGGTDGIDHVGLVVKANGNGTIQTVEGNTSNAVMVRERSVGSVVGYGYPHYAK
jgi:hypothetical protein